MSELTFERGRISARCAKEQQDRIDTAATLTGATINQFVLQAALEKADWVIDRERHLTVTALDAAMIMSMLENPPEPNEKLAALLENYRTKVNNGTLDTSVGHPSTPDR